MTTTTATTRKTNRSAIKIGWSGTEDGLRKANSDTPAEQFSTPIEHNRIAAMKAAGFSVTNLRYMGSRNTPAGYYGQYEVTLEK